MADEGITVKLRAKDESKPATQSFRRSFAELNSALEISRKIMRAVELVTVDMARAMYESTAAAAKNRAATDANAKAFRDASKHSAQAVADFRQTLGGVILDSGIFTALSEGFAGGLDAIADAFGGAGKEASALNSFIREHLAPGMVSAATIFVSSAEAISSAIKSVAEAQIGMLETMARFATKTTLGSAFMLASGQLENLNSAVSLLEGVRGGAAAADAALSKALAQLNAVSLASGAGIAFAGGTRRERGKVEGAKTEGVKKKTKIVLGEQEIGPGQGYQLEHGLIAELAAFRLTTEADVQQQLAQMRSDESFARIEMEIAAEEEGAARRLEIQRVFAAEAQRLALTVAKMSIQSLTQLALTGRASAKQFGAGLMGAVGSFMEHMGAAGMGTSAIFQALAAFNPSAGFAASAALFALGVGLQSAAGYAFSGGRGGGGGGGFSAPSGIDGVPAGGQQREPERERVVKLQIVDTSGGRDRAALAVRELFLRGVELEPVYE